MPVNLPLSSSVYLSIRLLPHPPIPPSVDKNVLISLRSVHPFVCPLVHLFINPFVRPPVHPTVLRSVRPSRFHKKDRRIDVFIDVKGSVHHLVRQTVRLYRLYRKHEKLLTRPHEIHSFIHAKRKGNGSFNIRQKAAALVACWSAGTIKS